MKNSNYDDDDSEEESNSNRCIYYYWTKMKILWRVVVMIRGKRIPTEISYLIDTNMENSNYDDDSEE